MAGTRTQLKSKVIGVWVVVVTVTFSTCGSLWSQSDSDRFTDLYIQTTEWQVVESNCKLGSQVNTHRIDSRYPRTENDKNEMFHFVVKSGTKRLAAYSIEPAYVIPELNPEVWIRANRSGIQMMVRVVLPETEHPDANGPLTTFIAGPVYRGPNRWRKLSFTRSDLDISHLLDRERPVLRSKHGVNIDTRNAYIDQVVLNLVAGPGETQVRIDDVEINGRVTVHDEVVRQIQDSEFKVDPQVTPATLEQTTVKRPDIKIDGSVIEIEGRPFAARVIEHNGESFEFLVRLGFNVIKLDRPPTAQQTLTARRLDIWLISPPPQQIGLTRLQTDYDRVLAWMIGEQLTDVDIARTESLAREIRESDSWKDRPLIASVATDRETFARTCSIIVNGFEPIGSSFTLSKYSDWLRQRADFAGRVMPNWAVIQTELTRELSNQVTAISGRVPPLPIDPCQLQFMAYETIASGSRGHWFVSRNRLDGSDPQSRLRANTIQWVLTQLSQMEPWIAGGAVLRRLDSIHNGIEVTTLKTNRSRLLLVQQPTDYEQWCSGTPAPREIQVDNPVASSSDFAYLLGETTLQPLDRGRQISSTQITIPNCPANAAIVMTNEPTIIRSLAERMSRAESEALVQLHTELTRSWLVLSQIVLNQIQSEGRVIPEASGPANEATNLMRHVSRLVSSGSALSSLPYLRQADQKLALVRQAAFLESAGSFSNGSRSPLFSHFSLLPLHWEFLTSVRSATLKPNGLIGGEFEELSQLTQSGWKNNRLDDESINTEVELSSIAARNGQNGLIIVANGPDQPMENAAVWIQSANVPVKAGQLIRVHGWVNIPSPIRQSLDGFMISDSIGGRNLAKRISQTDGWQEFIFYRGVSEDTDLKLSFALTGLGRVMLDEVTVQVLERNSFGGNDNLRIETGETNIDRQARQAADQDNN